MIKEYLYGLQHGYWTSFSAYRRRSEEMLKQVTNEMYKEETGLSTQEDADLRIQTLLDYQESINN